LFGQILSHPLYLKLQVRLKYFKLLLFVFALRASCTHRMVVYRKIEVLTNIIISFCFTWILNITFLFLHSSFP
jgi:hypothetical protein